MRMFCGSLFVLLYFFLRPLCCMIFFDILILITPLVSSNSSYYFLYYKMATLLENTLTRKVFIVPLYAQVIKLSFPILYLFSLYLLSLCSMFIINVQLIFVPFSFSFSYYAETKTVISIILQNRNIMRRF